MREGSRGEARQSRWRFRSGAEEGGGKGLDLSSVRFLLLPSEAERPPVFPRAPLPARVHAVSGGSLVRLPGIGTAKSRRSDEPIRGVSEDVGPSRARRRRFGGEDGRMEARSDPEEEGGRNARKAYPKADLRGLCAVVTGASSGIGEACAIRLSEEGARLVLVARRMDRLSALKEEILSRGTGSEVHLVELDVMDVDRIDRFLDDLPERFREVDILINNAGLALGIASVEANDMEQARVRETETKLRRSERSQANLPRGTWN